MKLPTVTAGQALIAGAVVVGGYFLYKWFGALKAGADAAGNAIGDLVAKAIVPSGVKVLGSVILPNGYKVPMTNIALGSDMRFQYGGGHYKIIRRDGDNYIAVSS